MECVSRGIGESMRHTFIRSLVISHRHLQSFEDSRRYVASRVAFFLGHLIRVLNVFVVSRAVRNLFGGVFVDC